jgi:peptide/nickel transport system substrate-binding protein/oligopeptide transport system substrate-binding protein
MERKLSRRDFLRHTGMIGGGLLTGAIVAACSPALPPQTGKEGVVEPAASPVPAAVPAGQPIYGGTLRVETKEIVDDVDPHTSWSHVEWCYSGRIFFEGLMEIDRQGKLVPRLADGWPEVSDDGRTYTFKIRQGVKWHNGREVVAQDFKYGLERASNPDTASWGQSYLAQVVGYDEFVDHATSEMEGVRVIDDHTLQVTLKAPQALFLTLLISTSTFPLPQEEVEKWGDKWGHEVVVGNGPFKVEEWVPDERLVVVKNPEYWDQGRPYLDAIELQMGVEPSVSLLKLERGEIDMMTSNIGPDIQRTVLGDPTWEDFVQGKPSITSLWMFMNMEIEPLNDLKVRQAINHAVDRDAILKLMGGGTPLYGVYPPGMPGYDPDFRMYSYDPDKARALLAEAGHPDGFKTGLMYNTDSDIWPTLAPIVQQQLAQIGVEVELVPMSHTTFIAQVNTPKTVPIGFQSWAAVFPDPNDMIGPQFTCDARGTTGANNAYYCNEQLEELLDQAESMTDLEQRAELYRQMNEMIMEVAPHVPLYAPQLYMLLHPRVKNFDFHPAMYAIDAYVWIDPSV